MEALAVKPAMAVWPRVCIKEICESITDCVNKTAPTVDYPTPFKMIRTTNVKGGWIDLSEVKYVTQDVFERWTRRSRPRKGDVILTREAPLGEVGMLRVDDTVFLGQRLVQYRANHEVLDNRFLLYAFREHDLQAQIKALGSGATVEHMRVPDAEKLTLRLPPLPVQHKIAAILSAYDDLIENNTRRIAILEEMARMLYREWFVEYRFPGHEQCRMVDSPLGKIPEGWRVVAMRDLVDLSIGGGWGQDSVSHEFPIAGYVIRGTDIPNVRLMSLASVPRRFHKQSNFGSRRLHVGDIVFEVSGGSKGQPVGRALFVSRELLRALNGEVVCASFCKLLRTNEQVASSEFLYHHLLEIYETGQINKYQVQSTGITNFKFQYFLDGEMLPVPDRSLMLRFTEFVRHLMAASQILGAENANLRTTRDLLLPKLVSGEVNVDELHIPTEAISA